MPSRSLADAALSAVLQAIVLGGVPFLAYLLFQRWRHGCSLREAAGRAGLRLGEPRYLAYGAAFALASAAALLVWPPPLEPLVREGSAQRQFAGLGFGVPAVARALLYGAVQTGFTEELLFRGLIAGSLARRLSFAQANLAQAAIFLMPHLAIVFVASELWGLLPVVFAAALVLGWLRIRSGSIAGPWLVHAAGNVTIALIVASRV